MLPQQTLVPKLLLENLDRDLSFPAPITHVFGGSGDTNNKWTQQEHQPQMEDGAKRLQDSRKQFPACQSLLFEIKLSGDFIVELPEHHSEPLFCNQQKKCTNLELSVLSAADCLPQKQIVVRRKNSERNHLLQQVLAWTWFKIQQIRRLGYDHCTIFS